VVLLLILTQQTLKLLLFKSHCLLVCGNLKVPVNSYYVFVGSSFESLWYIGLVIE